MNTLSTRTPGHLIGPAHNFMRKSDIRDLLMQSGIDDAADLDTAGLVERGSHSPNGQEMLRAPLLIAQESATFGNGKAHDALLKPSGSARNGSPPGTART